MGLRFRRRLRIAPGLALNFSKSGVSASVGRRGATLNVNAKGTQATVGLPGSGLSYRSRRVAHSSAPPNGAPAVQAGAGRTVAKVIVGLAIIAFLVYLIA